MDTHTTELLCLRHGKSWKKKAKDGKSQIIRNTAVRLCFLYIRLQS